MKNLLTIAIVLSTATAFATRARNTALGNSLHIADFYSPENLSANANTFTMETGSTAADVQNLTTTSDASKTAEGTLIKSTDMGVFGITLGHQEGLIYSQRSNSGVATVDAQQNPIQLGYGMKMSDMNVGFGLVYSKYDDKTAKQSETSTAVKAGVSNSLFYVNGMITVADSFKDDTANTEYKGEPSIALKAGYNINADTSVHATVTKSGYKSSSAGTTTKEIDNLGVQAMIIDTVKKEGSSFFYGAGLAMANAKEKVADKKIESMYMPFIFGLEATATSWMTLRGSVTQNVLISKEKDELTGKDVDPSANTTAVAVGAGFGLGKVTLDTTLQGLVSNATTSQQVNGTDLLAKAGLTYNF